MHDLSDASVNIRANILSAIDSIDANGTSSTSYARHEHVDGSVLVP